MAASDSVSRPIRTAFPSVGERRPNTARHRSPSEAALHTSVMMATDGVAVLLAIFLASMFRFDLSPTEWLHGWIWLFEGHSIPLNAGYLLFYFVALLVINRRVGRYGPPRVQGALHELRETIQGCLGA